jgi:hypothetical protein
MTRLAPAGAPPEATPAVHRTGRCPAFYRTQGSAAGSASRPGVRAAVVERAALRARLASDLLLLAGIARSAAAESVGTTIMIQHPGPPRGLQPPRELPTAARSGTAPETVVKTSSQLECIVAI